MIPMTDTERRILAELARRGEIRSFNRLVLDLRLSGPFAWRCLRRLERRGLVLVERGGPGKPVVIRPGRGG